MPKTTQNFIGKTAIFSNAAWSPSFHRKTCKVVADYAGQFNGSTFRFAVLFGHIPDEKPTAVREHELTFLD